MAGRKADDLDNDYAAAGFGNRLGFGEKPALLVVDMVQAYFKPGEALYAGVEAELAVTLRLIDEARAAGVPVIYTNVVFTPGGADGGRFFQKVGPLKSFIKGSPLGNWADGIAPREDEIVISKTYASSFFGTNLASTLTAMGVDTCLITGVTTSGCIRATALDALQHGFIPVVIADACGDRDERVQEANLFDLANKYADVVMSREVSDYLAKLG